MIDAERAGKYLKFLVGGANALRRNNAVPAARVLVQLRLGAWKSNGAPKLDMRRENQIVP